MDYLDWFYKVVSFLLLFSYKLDIMNVPFYMFLAYPNVP